MANYQVMRDAVVDMLDNGASDEEVSGYIKSQGVSVQEAKRNFAMLPPVQKRQAMPKNQGDEPIGFPRDSEAFAPKNTAYLGVKEANFSPAGNLPENINIDRSVRPLGMVSGIKPRNVEGLKPVASKLPTMEQSMQEEVNSRGPMDRFLAGVGTAADRAAYGLKKAVTGLTPQEEERLRLGKIASNNSAGLVGNIVGDTAIVSPASKLVSTAAGITTSPKLANLLGQTTLGAGYGALTTPDDRGSGALGGGAGGLLGTGIGMALGGAAKPAASSLGGKMLSEGVDLTPGQANGGMLQWLENRIRGFVPNIANAQQKGIESWNAKAISDVLPPGAAAQKGAGRDAINAAAKQWDQAFGDLYSKMGSITPDSVLANDLAGIYRGTAPQLTPEASKTLADQIFRLRGVFQNGRLAGRAINDEVRDYRTLATKANNDGNGRLGDAYTGIADSLEGLVGRQFPQLSQELGVLKSGYADFLRVQAAAGKQGAAEGVFTPKQLISAIREGDQTANKRAFARGNARKELLQSAEDASRVFGSDIPQVGPGTAEKIAVPLAIGSAGPSALIPFGIGNLLYTNPMRKFALGQYPWQQYISPGQAGALGMGAGLNANKRR